MSRKNKDPGRVRQIHPQASFKEHVSDAVLARVAKYVDEQVQTVAQALNHRSAQAMENLFTRLVALEEVVLEKLNLPKDALADQVALVQDRNQGFVPAQREIVEMGDRVRIEISTKTSDQAEFQGTSRLLIDNVGSGNTLGPELEGAIVGMTNQEQKEILFGKDQSLVAHIVVNRISVLQKPVTSAGDSEA